MIIREYIRDRLKPVQFLALAILLQLLLLYQGITWIQWLKEVLFLFFSFLAFRFLDDAGSVRFDRVGFPERSYLHESKYKQFLLWSIFILLTYLAATLFISPMIFCVVGTLILLSSIAYILLEESKRILGIIPLLKYPILLWCLTEFSMELESLTIILSSFFIMFIYDHLDDHEQGTKDKLVLFGAVLFCGILAFHPWSENIGYLFIVLGMGLMGVMIKWKGVKYLSIVYYPVLVSIQSLI